ncbi:PREDICTED: xylosyltransferase 1-like isoform 2 [Fragaria vesca subsp. vesca]
MGIKVLVVSLMLTSILFSFLHLIPTRLTTPTQPIINLTKSNMSITNPYPVTFSYLISASKGDSVKLKRMLYALYHPGNYYLIHMDYEATEAEHRDIAEFVGGNPVFGQVGNVWIVGKPNLVTYRGPTMLATTIHALALLLRTCSRDLNFIQHTSHLGWKLNKRGKPITIDPALYSLNKSELWWVIKQRTLPTAFKLYTGSAWTMLSRSFAEYCVVGWDNLPRTLLLYYTNFVSSPEGYFQTLICNSEDYKNTTINHDLHYISWDTPPKQHPRSLGLRDFRRMVQSNRPFARKFKENTPVLKKIDQQLLKRRRGQFAYGGWCSGKEKTQSLCSGLQSENYGVLRPGPGSRRLKSLLTKLISTRNHQKQQCR